MDLAVISSRRQVGCWHQWLRRRALLIGVGVFVAALAPRVFHLDSRSIWLDEETQARATVAGVGPELARHAARQGQPPLDYLLEGIGLKVLGWNEYGARMHAAVLGAGAAALFFGLLLTVARHPAAVLLGTVAFATQPWLIRYSQEGRPISCGVFFSVAWLWAVFRFLRARPTRDRTALVLRSTSVLASGVLFLLAVGFQPLVFLAVSSLALIPALVHRRFRRRVLAIWILTAVAGGVALPALILTARVAALYLEPGASQNPLVAVLHSAVGFRPGAWLERLWGLLGHLSALLFIVAPLGVTGTILLRRQQTQQERATLWYFGVFALAYPVVFHALYFGLVRLDAVALRYYLTAVPPLLVLLTLLFRSSLRVVCAGRPRARTVPRPAGVMLLAGAIVAASVQTASAVLEQYRSGDRTGWRPLYTLLKRDTRDHGRAYLMNLVAFGRWAPSRFSAASFYYPGQQPVVLKEIDALARNLSRGRLGSGADVYLVVHYGSESLASLTFDEMPGVTTHRFAELFVVHLAAGGDLEKDVRRVFAKMAATLPEEAANYKVYEVQARLSLQAKDAPGARRAIDTLSKLDADGRLQEAIISSLEKDLATMTGQ